MIAGFEGASRYYDDTTLGASDMNGTPVSVWHDQSGGGFHLTASGTAPTTQSPSVNGKSAVRWDGTNTPLANAEPLKLNCGFMVLRVDESLNFSNFAGVLSDLSNLPVLVGSPSHNYFYNFNYYFPKSFINAFEYRKNDRIDSSTPAPMSGYGVIFFRFWVPVVMDGVQLGKDRNLSNRLAKMSVVMMALYENPIVCEREIREKQDALASRYALTLSSVFPFQADADVETQNTLPANQDFPESGGVIAETLGNRGIVSNLQFSNRDNVEAQAAEQFIDSHYPGSEFIYRSYRYLPPRDSVGTATEPLRDSGNPATRTKSYSFPFRGTR